MANVDRKNGFRPVKHLNGSPFNGKVGKYEIAAGDATATFVGDLVVLSDLAATDNYPAVEIAGTSGSVTAATLVGAIVGFDVDETNLNTASQYRLASTKRFCYVADAVDVVFEVQEDAVGGALARASIGLNAGFDATAGSTTTGMSAMQLDTSTAATTNTLPLTILGFSTDPANEPAVANAKVLVKINTHQYANGATGV